MAAQTHTDVGGILRPQGHLDLATALAPYEAALGERAAAHLLRRAGFGGSPDDVRRYAAMTAHDAVSQLMKFPSPQSIAPPPALADFEQGSYKGKARGRAGRRTVVDMQQWWLDRMLSGPAPLQEKMTLYFHGHFTSRATPRFAWITYNQNALFRRYALG
ncbi:MAG: DUF1800 family protein, partial [Candidatus Eremiobacteraeota bacterium]|nr:DUF1800 family protein [Candidatus Eremiobacteraeota bacterium]